MPRTARSSVGGMVYHVYNRGNAGMDVFQTAEDYGEILQLLCEGEDRTRLLAYCVLPSHFHLVLWPREDGELSQCVQWLTTTHVRRYLSRHGARKRPRSWRRCGRAWRAGRLTEAKRGSAAR